MIHILALANGSFVSLGALEILFTPPAESPETGNERIRTCFTRLLTAFHRKSEPDLCALELLLPSLPADDGSVRVKMFLLLRRIDSDRAAGEAFVQNLLTEMRTVLEENDFTVSEFSFPSAFTQLESMLEQVHFRRVLSISRKEKAAAGPFPAAGMLYYLHTPTPAASPDPLPLHTALARYPDSVLSLQLIPTRYRDTETAALQTVRSTLGQRTTYLHFRHGLQADVVTQTVMDAYDACLEAGNEPLFQYNILLWSSAEGAGVLADRLTELLDADGKTAEGAVDIVDVTDFALTPADNLFASPWIRGDVLVNRARDEGFWNSPQAPVRLQRLKQLLTLREIRAAFTLPACSVTAANEPYVPSASVSPPGKRAARTVEGADGIFRLGTLSGAGMPDGLSAGVDPSEFTGHGLLAGDPGSGGNALIPEMLRQLQKDFHIPFLVIAPSGNRYRALAGEIPSLAVYTPGRPQVSPCSLNPFQPPAGVSAERYIPCLLAAFRAAFALTPLQTDLLGTAVDDCYRAYGWRGDSTPGTPGAIPFGLYEFLRFFRRNCCRGTDTPEENALAARLETLLIQDGALFDAVCSTLSPEAIGDSPAVVELDAMRGREQKVLAAALLIGSACLYRAAGTAGGALRQVILLEDAQLFGDVSDAMEPLSGLIADAREHGIGVLFSLTHPAALRRELLQNTNVKILFRTVDREDRRVLSGIANLSEEDCALLERMPEGCAFLHTRRTGTPIPIRTAGKVLSVPDPSASVPLPPGDGTTPAPFRECACSPFCAGRCSPAVRSEAFFAAARLRNRYLTSGEAGERLPPDRFADTVLRDTAGENKRLYDCVRIQFLRRTLPEKQPPPSEEAFAALFAPAGSETPPVQAEDKL